MADDRKDQNLNEILENTLNSDAAMEEEISDFSDENPTEERFSGTRFVPDEEEPEPIAEPEETDFIAEPVSQERPEEPEELVPVQQILEEVLAEGKTEMSGEAGTKDETVPEEPETEKVEVEPETEEPWEEPEEPETEAVEIAPEEAEPEAEDETAPEEAEAAPEAETAPEETEAAPEAETVPEEMGEAEAQAEPEETEAVETSFTDVSEEPEEPKEPEEKTAEPKPEQVDDFEFISTESVKDKSRMAKGTLVYQSKADQKRTHRRNVDEQEAKKEKKVNFARRYKVLLIIIVVLIIAALVVLAHYAKQVIAQKAAENKELPLSTQEYEKDENEQINDLVAAYYEAYAQGDTEGILKYAYPMTENEKSYIEMYATFVQDYENIVCYTKTGLDDTSYIVSAAFDLKYKGVETTAAGLDFFYVRTADDGTMYIDNTYSPYNLTYQENALDPEILQLITDYQAGDDVTALLASVQIQYEDAVASDEALTELVDNEIPAAVAQWQTEKEEADQAAQAEAAAQVQQDSSSDTSQDTAAENTEDAVAPAVTVNETEQKAWVYVTETVNIRQTPDENGTILASATKGSQVRQTAVTENGWSKVYTGNVVGYIKSEYISTEQTASSDSSSSSSSGRSVNVGDSIYLTASVNVRKSMSESADRVGLAYSGETVEVIQVYSEGWCKVSWNGKTGYIKTEVLQGM